MLVWQNWNQTPLFSYTTNLTLSPTCAQNLLCNSARLWPNEIDGKIENPRVPQEGLWFPEWHSALVLVWVLGFLQALTREECQISVGSDFGRRRRTCLLHRSYRGTAVVWKWLLVNGHSWQTATTGKLLHRSDREDNLRTVMNDKRGQLSFRLILSWQSLNCTSVTH